MHWRPLENATFDRPSSYAVLLKCSYQEKSPENKVQGAFGVKALLQADVLSFREVAQQLVELSFGVDLLTIYIKVSVKAVDIEVDVQ